MQTASPCQSSTMTPRPAITGHTARREPVSTPTPTMNTRSSLTAPPPAKNSSTTERTSIAPSPPPTTPHTSSQNAKEGPSPPTVPPSIPPRAPTLLTATSTASGSPSIMGMASPPSTTICSSAARTGAGLAHPATGLPPTTTAPPSPRIAIYETSCPCRRKTATFTAPSPNSS